MKRLIFILVVFLTAVFLLVGCGGSNSGGGPKPTPTPIPGDPIPTPEPGAKYTLKVVVPNSAPVTNTSIKVNNFIAKGLTAAGDPVDKDPSWFKDRPETSYLSYGNYQEDGTYWGPASASAKIYDSEGAEVTLTPEQKLNIVWSSPDSERFYLQGDGDMIGDSVSFNSYAEGVFNFTAVYTYQVEENGEMVDKTATGSATVLVVTRGRIDPGNNSADVKAGYIFATNTGTDTLSQADFWITQENGINYINAPGGVSLLLNVENDIDGLTNWRILGSVLKVPDGLTYTTKTPCIWYGTFAIKDRNGSGYTKVTSFLGPDSSIAWPTAFIYVHSSNNTFQITY